jgi:hypothetical protein
MYDNGKELFSIKKIYLETVEKFKVAFPEHQLPPHTNSWLEHVHRIDAYRFLTQILQLTYHPTGRLRV